MTNMKRWSENKLRNELNYAFWSRVKDDANRTLISAIQAEMMRRDRIDEGEEEEG